MRVCVCVCNLKIYIPNSMLHSINDKLEKYLVKYFFFYRTYFFIFSSIFNGKSEITFLIYRWKFYAISLNTFSKK